MTTLSKRNEIDLWLSKTKPAPSSRKKTVAGDARTHGTNYTITKSGTYDFSDLEITHRALNASGQAQLVTIEDVENVMILNLNADGESLKRNGVTIRGMIKNVTLDGGNLTNLRNFGVQYADSRTSPRLAYINGLTIKNYRISGAVGPTGDGSGLNLFPRSTNFDGSSAATNVVVTDNWIDVSQRELDNEKHGPQAFKFNNINGLWGEYNYARGGDICAFNITNGCRNVYFNVIETEFANRGLQIDNDANFTKGNTGDITVNHLSYRHENVRGERIGLYIDGNVPNITINSVDTNGTIIISKDNNSTLQRLRLHNITLREGAVFSVGSTAPALPITQSKLGPFTCQDNEGAFAVNIGNAYRSFNETEIYMVSAVSSQRSVVQNYGQGNYFHGIIVTSGNTTNSVNTAALIDWGDQTHIARIAVGGAQNLSYFARKRGGNGFKIDSVSGVVTDVFGFSFENQERSSLPIGNLSINSPFMDLAAAPQIPVPFFTASTTCYLIGIMAVFQGGTGDRVMKAVQLRKNSDNIVNYVTPSRLPAGTMVNFSNTVGINASAKRHRKLNRGDQLTCSTIGSGVGVGTCRWVVNIVQAED